MKMKFISKGFNDLSLIELYEILRARSQIFIVEGHMHCQDIDGVDIKARHFFIEKDGKVMAYLRAFYDDDSKIRKHFDKMLLAQAKSYLHILRKQNISRLPVGKYFTRRRRISPVPKERISLKTLSVFPAP